MTTIPIAGDHDVVRFGLLALLSEVVAEEANGKEAVAQAIKTKPDVAIIDHSLRFLNGVEVTRQIRQFSPDTAVLIFTMHDRNLIHDSLSGGCLGYVLKSGGSRLLLTAIDTVVQHTSGPDSPLSARERSVVGLVAELTSDGELS